MKLHPLAAAVVMLLVLCPAAQASVKSDLKRQVETELAGDGVSCQLMSQGYQDLFSYAAQSIIGEAGCPAGVRLMQTVRQGASGKYFSRQAKNQIRAIGRGRVQIEGEVARIKIRYPGTPPGWKFRKRHKTREYYRMIRGADGWLTDSVRTIVRPPIAFPVS